MRGRGLGRRRSGGTDHARLNVVHLRRRQGSAALRRWSTSARAWRSTVGSSRTRASSASSSAEGSEPGGRDRGLLGRRFGRHRVQRRQAVERRRRDDKRPVDLGGRVCEAGQAQLPDLPAVAHDEGHVPEHGPQRTVEAPGSPTASPSRRAMSASIWLDAPTRFGEPTSPSRSTRSINVSTARRSPPRIGRRAGSRRRQVRTTADTRRSTSRPRIRVWCSASSAASPRRAAAAFARPSFSPPWSKSPAEQDIRPPGRWGWSATRARSGHVPGPHRGLLGTRAGTYGARIGHYLTRT